MNDETVTATIGMAAKNTLFLSVFAFLLYVPVTLILATLAALSKGKLPDSLISVVTLIGLSLPEFVLGTAWWSATRYRTRSDRRSTSRL